MKQLFGIDTLGSYVFNKTAKTITFSGLTLSLSNILVINNATANTLIYNFASSTTGASSFVNNVLTLDYDTSSMNDTDVLQIWIDIEQQGIVKTQEVNNADALLGRMYLALLSPRGYDSSLNRIRETAIIESGTVTTVTTVSNMAALGGVQAQISVYGENRTAWQLNVRTLIV